VRIAPHHLLSLSRIVLGLQVLSELRVAPYSKAVLPAVALACAADYADGVLARRFGGETTAGRLLDNVCDVTFLALAFCGFAAAGLWSTAFSATVGGSWSQVEWLPLAALAASFGTYLLRWWAAYVRGATPRPSARGHLAGIANYVLAVVGALEAHPAIGLGAWVLAAAFVTVVSLNIAAGADNLRMLASGQRDAAPGT
jgi:phosphatidylglycerophosphate synthase